jgi:hypothetical protein
MFAALAITLVAALACYRRCPEPRLVDARRA